MFTLGTFFLPKFVGLFLVARLGNDFCPLGGDMPTPITQNYSLGSHLRRALGLWPYVFIAVSIAGLVYIASNAVR